MSSGKKDVTRLRAWRSMAIAMAIYTLGSFRSELRAQESEYLIKQPPTRLALVIGNATYDNVAPIGGAIDDAKKIADLLEKAAFNVTLATNVQTRNEFLVVHFMPFVEKIQEGDFVVFYFSGHGFVYSGENYLVPTKFPKEVTDDDIFGTFLSVKGLRSLMDERKPGVLIMFLDACRNIAGFIKHKDTQKNDFIAKGLAEVRRLPQNVIISFSSSEGTTSSGSELAGQLSVYTASLSKFLPQEDTEFGTLKRLIREDVAFETNSSQIPWFSDSNSAEIYFHPSQTILAQELTLWKSILSAAVRRDIVRFLGLYSISQYAAAARKWLTNNLVHAAASFTRISPSGPELAWNSAISTDQSVRLRNVSGPLAFSRTMRNLSDVDGQINVATTEYAPTITARDVVAKAGPNKIAGARSVANVLAQHVDAVVTAPVAARARPTENSNVVSDLSLGTRLSVLGVERNPANQTWVRIAVPDSSQPAYVKMPTGSASGETNIGKPLLEANVSGRASGLQSLVDEAPLLAELNKLTAAKKSVQWVSIATPFTTDMREAAIYGMRAIYLTSVLETAGISRRRISTLENASDLKGTNLRVRFFGN